MPNNPTTKSQVQAYRFVLRRMQSALVRRDAVMLHEPMRTHMRAGVVGLIIGVLICAGFFVVGLFSQDDDLADHTIVIGKQSGAVFVVQPDPRRLVPVYNLASARLLVAAQAGSGAAGSGAGPAEPQLVEDSSLADLPRAPITGLQGAPADLPGPEEQVSGNWSVCDTATVDPALPDGEADPDLSTTALAGVPAPGRDITGDEALLVQDDLTDTAYLVFDGHRGEVDLDNNAVRDAYGTAGIEPRRVTNALLNAIPQGDELNPPTVLGEGDPSEFPSLAEENIEVGSVVRVELTTPQYFLILRAGKQPVNEAVAELIRVDDDEREFTTVPPDTTNVVPEVSGEQAIDFDDFPQQRPTIQTVTDTPVACFAWRGPDSTPAITVNSTAGFQLGESQRPVDLPGADGSGPNLDRAYVPPGQGALVRGVVPGQDSSGGVIFLVTDQGLRYGIPSLDVAAALGLGQNTTPAPESVLGLLPTGPPLNPQDALELFDPALAAEARQQGG